MEFVIQQKDLLRELQTVTGVVEKRATLPILTNLLLETRGEALQVGASDLEVTIRGRAKATVIREGSVTLPAGKLHDIARSLPDSEVQFKLLDGEKVQISCERVRYRIAGHSREEFPAFPALDESKGIAIPGRVLREMIERVEFAITTEDPRYSLNGALVLIEGGNLTLVATDGHRLAYASRKLEGSGRDTPELRVIVPRKALGEVAKLTADLAADETVLFGKADHHVYFVVGEHRLTSNVLEGNFPRYENVMPKACDTELLLPTLDFTNAVRRVSLLASDRFGKAVRLNLTRGKLEVSCRTEVGEAEETLEIDYDGAEVSIGFNARYLLDFLSVVGTDLVKLELNPQRPGDKPEAGIQAGDKPGQLRPEPPGEMDYRCVVMPMHL